MESRHFEAVETVIKKYGDRWVHMARGQQAEALRLNLWWVHNHTRAYQLLDEYVEEKKNGRNDQTSRVES